ncbi:glutaredoxin Grx1 [Schizosaccharomyces cryophilus OY26]|uniref:Glutaredoxin Grx1 n=1 Tax=Schizosaccharomyces cryophilus (strain OY26 / ATCC MYA-4695 / CBS 11777 / NBRC 106824 / NRRL Y48691) TaxID=653667 RepID=S9XFQ0_SCHCR|nr:glutaredoxin Grx1 [Schizosaccharomyces cryophilus OY26]EPY52466.1 glutaredoxin Grx1 [Schizosaccharomyces cryophilus OY26]
MSVVQLVESAIADNDVVVFAKTYCPYCHATEKVIADEKIKAKIFQLDTLDNGDEIQAYLLKKTGQRTVPNVFIHQKHIGGNSDFQDLYKKGGLATLSGTA